MADRRSPLQGYASRFARLPESTRIVEEPFVAMVDLWADPAVVAEAVGDAATVIRLGPQEFLVTSTTVGGEQLESRLRAATVEQGGAAVDVSAQRTTLRLSGSRARDVLAKGCSLDLHPLAFGPGATAQTMLGQAAVVLISLGDDGFRILVRASFARYLADWLLDATLEYR